MLDLIFLDAHCPSPSALPKDGKQIITFRKFIEDPVLEIPSGPAVAGPLLQ